MSAELQRIMNKLDSIQSELDYIKNHIADVDLVLTDEDLHSIKEGEEDWRAGKTRRIA